MRKGKLQNVPYDFQLSSGMKQIGDRDIAWCICPLTLSGATIVTDGTKTDLRTHLPSFISTQNHQV